MWMSTLAMLPGESLCLSVAPWVLPVVCGSVLLTACVAVGAMIWAFIERRERRASQKLSSSLSDACHQLTEQHYRERVQAEERHLLTHDSSVRNVLESLERALLGKPRS